MPDIERTRRDIEDVIGIPAEDAPAVSAKTALNIGQVLERIVTDIPSPSGNDDAPLRALIFDSVYDPYKGVIVYVRLFDGTLSVGDTVRMMHTGAEYEVVETGIMRPFGLQSTGRLGVGEVGYFTASIKTIADTLVGDTVTCVENPTDNVLPGFKKAQPMVFSGIYPADGSKYGDLRDALEKLALNDSSFTYEAESSVALGFGFRCGFLGLLHTEVVEERLEREYNLDLVTTAPSVVYKVEYNDGRTVFIDNPTNYPKPEEIKTASEPIVKAAVITPSVYVGTVMELCTERRGTFIDMKYIDPGKGGASLRASPQRDNLRLF